MNKLVVHLSVILICVIITSAVCTHCCFATQLYLTLIDNGTASLIFPLLQPPIVTNLTTEAASLEMYTHARSAFPVHLVHCICDPPII